MYVSAIVTGITCISEEESTLSILSRIHGDYVPGNSVAHLISTCHFLSSLYLQLDSFLSSSPDFAFEGNQQSAQWKSR